MKRKYAPTDADRLTGENLRNLRRRSGQHLRDVAQQSNFGKDYSTLAKVERGERLLTDVEAAKLAAHFGVSVDAILVRPDQVADVKGMIGDAWPKTMKPAVETEQQFLGNERPALFAVKDHQQQVIDELAAVAEDPRTLRINLDAPLSPADYHAQVWVPFLEARYAADKTA